MRKPNRYLIKYDLDMSDNIGDGLGWLERNHFEFCRGRKEVNKFISMAKWHAKDFGLFYLNLKVIKFNGMSQ